MHHSKHDVNESTLNINLNELVHGFARELAMAAKKVSIYGSGHPVANRSLAKPFMMAAQIFNVKRYVNINLLRGELYILNICLKDSVFTKEIIRFMQILDLSAILFECHLSMNEFTAFMGRFVKRVNVSDHRNLLSAYLREKKIDSIQVNSEFALELFESHRQYRGEVDGDFSVRGMALQQLGDDLETLAAIASSGEQALDAYRIDFDCDVISYILPEKIAALPPERLISSLKGLYHNIIDSKGETSRDNSVEIYKSVWRLLDHHTDRDRIVQMLETDSMASGENTSMLRDLCGPAMAIKQDSVERIDQVLDELLTEGNDDYTVDAFADAFSRLLKTGQREKAVHKIHHLIDRLADNNVAFRQKALNLLISSIEHLNLSTDQIVLERAVEDAVDRVIHKEETYEYSEFIRQLLETSLIGQRYDLLARLTGAMAVRRKIERGVTIYDSMAIKQGFAGINSKEVLDSLIGELIHADFQKSSRIREVLVNIGSEEVALALTNIISHPDRHVRQQSLKILGELGKASLKVCSQILMDDGIFERDASRHELPDCKWYVIRNSIFVLGLLKDVEGVAPLRLRINDNDIRVRREIVSALEKIGGEDACDLLVLMADDPVKEIRDRAVITVGLIGTSDMVPLLIDTARRYPAVTIHAITALGKLGGEEARQFLVGLLDDGDSLADFAGGQISKDDLRLAIVKALGSIGDDGSIDKIKKYKDNLSTTQKLFFKNSPVNKAITDILSKQ